MTAFCTALFRAYACTLQAFNRFAVRVEESFLLQLLVILIIAPFFCFCFWLVVRWLTEPLAWTYVRAY